MQVRLPLPVVLQVFRNALREKNVPRIAAIHHPLRDVNSSSSNIGSIVNVSNLVDRATVNANPQLQLPMFFNFLSISSAQRTGASGLLKKTSAIPSPAGIRISLPAASARQTCSVLWTISVSPL